MNRKNKKNQTKHLHPHVNKITFNQKQLSSTKTKYQLKKFKQKVLFYLAAIDLG